VVCTDATVKLSHNASAGTQYKCVRPSRNLYYGSANAAIQADYAAASAVNEAAGAINEAAVEASDIADGMSPADIAAAAAGTSASHADEPAAAAAAGSRPAGAAPSCVPLMQADAGGLLVPLAEVPMGSNVCEAHLRCARTAVHKSGVVDIEGVICVCCRHGVPGHGTLVDMPTAERYQCVLPNALMLGTTAFPGAAVQSRDSYLPICHRRYYDAVFFELLKTVHPSIVYLDFGCQYSAHAHRVLGVHGYVPRFLVPWMHAKGHNTACQLQWSAFYKVRVGTATCFIPSDASALFALTAHESSSCVASYAAILHWLDAVALTGGRRADRRRAERADVERHKPRQQAPALHGSVQPQRLLGGRLQPPQC